MEDAIFSAIPDALEAIEYDTKQAGFSMPSERTTGLLLKTLAATKPGGRILELGTGTGLSTAWLLSGMDASALLDSVDNDGVVLAIAQRHLARDKRVRFCLCEGEDFIARAMPESFDLIFADAWPGKYTNLDETLRLLKEGGIYVIDDMSPQPNWPAGHEKHVRRLIHELKWRADLVVCFLTWATGLAICTRVRAG